jgi:arginyl-tRNA synthetase
LDLAVVTTSVEQTDYFKVIIHCLELLRPELKGKYKHIPFGWLLRDNKKTSSRMGDTVKGADIIEEAKEMARKELGEDRGYDEKTQAEIVDKVALAGLKFLILSHEFHNNINYDPESFIKLRGFSGPFILYSYVRINSIVKKVVDVDLARRGELDDLPVSSKTCRGEIFEKFEEKQLASALAMYSDTVLRAGTEIAPHIICNYLYEVAQKFNAFYEHCSIQKAENEAQKKSRLLLAMATGQILKNGLSLLGIDVLEKM